MSPNEQQLLETASPGDLIAAAIVLLMIVCFPVLVLECCWQETRKRQKRELAEMFKQSDEDNERMRTAISAQWEARRVPQEVAAPSSYAASQAAAGRTVQSLEISPSRSSMRSVETLFRWNGCDSERRICCRHHCRDCVWSDDNYRGSICCEHITVLDRRSSYERGYDAGMGDRRDTFGSGWGGGSGTASQSVTASGAGGRESEVVYTSRLASTSRYTSIGYGTTRRR